MGMGVLPLQFSKGENWKNLGLDGSEEYSIQGIAQMHPQKELRVLATKDDGSVTDFHVVCRLNTEVEVTYFEHGGILPYVLRKMSKKGRAEQ